MARKPHDDSRFAARDSILSPWNVFSWEEDETMNSQAMPDNEPPTEDLAPPTRPRRAIEQDFLAALADVVSLDDWREVSRGDNPKLGS